jgi:hypothetical protein
MKAKFADCILVGLDEFHFEASSFTVKPPHYAKLGLSLRALAVAFVKVSMKTTSSKYVVPWQLVSCIVQPICKPIILFS